MKRAFLAITGTIAGLVALLGFKTHSVSLVGVPSAPARQPVAQQAGSGASSSGASRPPTSRHSGTPPRQPAPKRYLGPAVQTPYGVVQVALKVSHSGRILAVRLPRLTAFDSTSQMINSQAAPILVRETLAAQGDRIDAVSGATYTSEGYLQSLQAALNKAGI